MNSAELRAVSYLETAMSLDQPLMGWESPRVEIPNTPYFIPSSAETTAFHQFFGLSPALAEVPLPEAFKSDRPYSDLVEQSTDAYVQGTLKRADRAFKAGTTRNVPDRYEQLAVARRLYGSVLTLDKMGYLPAMLGAHAALEKEQHEQAIVFLMEAVKRHPALFSDRPDISTYFGDASLLEEQARRYVRVAEQAGGSGMNWALQAYAAWVLKDALRLREALDGLENVSRERPGDRRLEGLRLALRATQE
jgi:hypothetical protein